MAVLLSDVARWRITWGSTVKKYGVFLVCCRAAFRHLELKVQAVAEEVRVGGACRLQCALETDLACSQQAGSNGFVVCSNHTQRKDSSKRRIEGVSGLRLGPRIHNFQSDKIK